MESRRKRSRSQRLKWGCYILLLVVCTVLQTMPGLFQFGAAKPLWLLPLCLAVSAAEGEFAGAIFGAVCGLMWDYTAGRTVGMLALELMILCFGVSVVVQLYLKDTPSNFVLLAVVCALLVLSADWLFFYYMPGYAGAGAFSLGRAAVGPDDGPGELVAPPCSAAHQHGIQDRQRRGMMPDPAGRKTDESRRTQDRGAPDGWTHRCRLGAHRRVCAAADIFAARQQRQLQGAGDQHHRL